VCSSMSFNLATLRHQIRAIPLSHHPWEGDWQGLNVRTLEITLPS
jgi:hypothetical protein